MRERKKRRTREALITAAMGCSGARATSRPPSRRSPPRRGVGQDLLPPLSREEDLVMAEVSERVALARRARLRAAAARRTPHGPAAARGHTR
ncbi:hypothetical protein [Nonomuraea dietziae]|uniref:hypothetical protein n=1 Tax=Nonomuraea dietziae TaxID=65515 RepID=UPI0031D793B2